MYGIQFITYQPLSCKHDTGSLKYKKILYLISIETQGSRSINSYPVTFCRMPVHFGHSCNVCLAAAMHAVATSDGFTEIRHTSGMFENKYSIKTSCNSSKMYTYFPNVFFVIVCISLGTITNSVQSNSLINPTNHTRDPGQVKHNIAIYI